MVISEAARLRLLYFLFFSCTAAWLPIFAEYLEDRGLKGVMIGVLSSITPLMMLLVQPFYGAIADRVGYKKCLVVSAFCSALSYGLYLFDGGLGYLIAITVAMSIFYNSIQPLLDSLSLTFIDRNPGFSYGSLRLAGAAGYAVTGIAAGYFIDKLSTEVIFIFSGISMALTFLVALFLHVKTPAERLQNKTSGTDIMAILARGRMAILLVWVCLVYAASAPIYYFYSIYMKENGASSNLTGFAISFQGLCEIPLFYFSAVIIKRFGLKLTLIICVVATALRLLLYSYVKNPYFVFPIELLHGIGWSLFLVACIEQVNKSVNEEARATGQSLLYAALLGAGAILGNLWSGFLYEKMKVSEIYLLNAGITIMLAMLLPIIMRSSVSGTMKRT
jgi:PPP family 3-phenylpropionic acid transporter